MAKAERGTKRQCQKCATKFYDLNADPIVCPSCGAPFALVVEKPVEEETVVADAEASVAPKATEEADVDTAAAEAGAEIVSFEDAEESDDDDDDIPDVADVEDVDDIGGEVDNSFIEDDDADDKDDDLGIPVERRSDDE